MRKIGSKDKFNPMIKELYEIVLYDANSNRNIRIGALNIGDYRKYFPIAIKNSLSQKKFWFFLLDKLKDFALKFIFSFIMYLIVIISFIFIVSNLPFKFDILLKILTNDSFLFVTNLYLITSLCYYLILFVSKSSLYFNRELVKLFLNNSIFNNTDYDYEKIYLIKKFKFK